MSGFTQGEWVRAGWEQNFFQISQTVGLQQNNNGRIRPCMYPPPRATQPCDHIYACVFGGNNAPCSFTEMTGLVFFFSLSFLPNQRMKRQDRVVQIALLLHLTYNCRTTSRSLAFAPPALTPVTRLSAVSVCESVVRKISVCVQRM